ncbi:terpene synthase family protein [Streptomyces capillispiralis]|uniref:terpene synthase family protein n=1 Tax=Streptomyces capillispiralis TaxID=68182 RepID=UPI0036AD573C
MTDLENFELPDFFCPVAPSKHPEVEAIEAASIEWIEAVGIAPTARQRKALIDTKAAHLCSHIIPSGPVDRMAWFSNLTYWFWAVDAHSDEGRASREAAQFACLASRISDALSTPQSLSPSDPLLKAAHQCAVTFSKLGSPTQMRRWRDEHQHWLFAMVHQVAISEQRRMPDVGEYLVHRIPGGAAAVLMATVEMVTGQTLPIGIADTPRVRALTEMTGLIVSIDNDLLSYPLEQQSMENTQNIVNVLMHHHDLPLSSAVAQAAAMRDTVMLRFLELASIEKSKADRPLSAYLDSMYGSISGNLTWAPKAPRYADRFPGAKVDVRVTDHTEALDQPLPYSTTAWWWTV